MKFAGFTLILMWIYSCSDFHFAVVSNGSIPDLSIIDTVRIPADSIVVEALFDKNDTLFQADSEIRPGWHVEIPLSLKNRADELDSVWLYGSVLASDTLQLALVHADVVDPLPVQGIDTSGGRFEHQIKILVLPGVDYQIRVESRKGATLQFGALLLLGYESRHSSGFQVVDRITQFREKKIFAMDQVELPVGSTKILRFQMEEMDSLHIGIHGTGNFNGLIVDNHRYDQYLVDGEVPTRFLWQQDLLPVSIDWSNESMEQYALLMINQDQSVLSLTDTVFAYRWHFE